jgi:hypothetical protein
MFTKYLKSIVIISILALSGCKDRLDSDIENGYADNSVKYDKPIIHELPKFLFANKRLIDDYDCDGIDDVLGMADITSFWEDKKFKGKFYKGYYKEDGFLSFYESEDQINIPFLIEKWDLSQKLNSLKLNNDSCSDLVYSKLPSSTNNLVMNFAINQDFSVDHPNKIIKIKEYLEDEKYHKSIESTKILVTTFINNMKKKSDLKPNNYNILDYYQQNWCDFNGDGADDLVMFWNSNDDLDISVLYSTPYGKEGYSEFLGGNEFTIPQFLFDRTLSNIDTEDYNGDGVCDIISYSKGRHYLDVNVALFKDKQFIPEKTLVLRMPPNLDFVSDASKFDTFDRTNDNKADLNFITEKNGKQIIVTWVNK